MELLVTISILAVINGLILASLPETNSRFNLKRTANESSLLLRQAQSYALGIRRAEVSGGGESFNGYGVHFSNSNSNDKNKTLVIFTDLDGGTNKRYDESNEEACGEENNECVQKYMITTGDYIQDLCAGSDENNCDSADDGKLDIFYERSSPFLAINAGGNAFAKATIKSPRGENNNTKDIKIWSTGQIEIE